MRLQALYWLPNLFLKFDPVSGPLSVELCLGVHVQEIRRANRKHLASVLVEEAGGGLLKVLLEFLLGDS